MQSIYFLWVKWLHVVAVVSWFAGLFYLPRLFVYHAMTDDVAGRARFATMERKLYRAIMAPAAVVAVLSGLALWHFGGPWGGWVHVKAVLAVGLVLFHFYCGRQIKQLENGGGQSGRWYRWFNEIPTVFLLLMVWLVIFKPWSS